MSLVTPTSSHKPLPLPVISAIRWSSSTIIILLMDLNVYSESSSANKSKYASQLTKENALFLVLLSKYYKF